MHASRRLLCTALLGLAAGLSSASVLAAPAEPQEGKQYQSLPSPQPTDTGKKVEVIEFFAYYCPHCHVFEPQLAAWVRKQGDNIVFKRVHVSRGAAVQPQQRLFYTLEAMGLLEQYHQKAFDAMHVERLRLGSDQEVIDWAARTGIDRAKFTETYRSFGIQARLRRADAMMDAYGIDHWPKIVVDGRYATSPSMVNEGASEAQQQQAALQVMDVLVAKSRAARQ